MVKPVIVIVGPTASGKTGAGIGFGLGNGGGNFFEKGTISKRGGFFL